MRTSGVDGGATLTTTKDISRLFPAQFGTRTQRWCPVARKSADRAPRSRRDHAPRAWSALHRLRSEGRTGRLGASTWSLPDQDHQQQQVSYERREQRGPGRAVGQQAGEDHERAGHGDQQRQVPAPGPLQQQPEPRGKQQQRRSEQRQDCAEGWRPPPIGRRSGRRPRARGVPPGEAWRP